MPPINPSPAPVVSTSSKAGIFSAVPSRHLPHISFLPVVPNHPTCKKLQPSQSCYAKRSGVATVESEQSLSSLIVIPWFMKDVEP